MVEERNDSVNVLFSTEKSIWILGVSYRLRKNTRSVILPSAIQADSTQLHVDSSLFLNHHHQKRSASPNRTQNGRKPDAPPQRRSEDVGGNRRRANTSGVMMNKKKLQAIAQLQNYPGMPPLPEPGTPGIVPAIPGTRPLASIPSQDLLLSKQSNIGMNLGVGISSRSGSSNGGVIGPTPISPMPFPDDPATVEPAGRLGQETDNDTEIDGESIVSTTRKSGHLAQSQVQPVEQRSKSSKMGRLRSWVARTAKPMRRKSDALSDVPTKECNASSNITSRPASPQPPKNHPMRLSNDAPPQRLVGGVKTPSVMSSAVRTSTNVSANFSSGSDPRALGIAIPSQSTHLRRKSKETLTSVSGSYAVSEGMRRSWYESDAGSNAHPPVPPMPIPSRPDSHSLASVGASGGSSSYYEGRSAALNRNPAIASSVQLRPTSSHSHAQSQKRIASGSSSHTNSSSNNTMVIGPTRREAAVR
ncbi:hypothetical protein EV175_005107, partial [Coemansia sp. RSA 1933]